MSADDRQQAGDTADAQRRLQREIDEKDGDAEPGGDGAIQAGARRYPEPPFPEQHLRKPGVESALEPAPLYDAPYWRGSGKLEGKVALITGGDSGIGRSVATLFAREGADIAIVYLSEHQDADATRLAVEDEGRRCLTISGDISDRGFCDAAVAKVAGEFDQLDILVNNAGFQLHVERIEDLTEAHFDRTLKTNLYGCFHMTQAALAHLPYGGAIVNSGSVTGLRGSAALPDYSMTKGGIHAFTKAMASHLLPRGVRVNAVAPGPVWTPLNPADRPAEEVSRFGADTPMQRPAQPEEIAPAFLFLASAQCSSYITGEILPVIGGY